MAIFQNSIIPAAAAAAGDVITKSVRFNRASDPYMTFTPSSTGNQKKWTNAMWIKRSAVGISAAAYFGLTCEDHSGAHNDGVCGIYFGGGDDKLDTYFDTAVQGAPYGNINDRVYRDPAGWMQIIWAVDAANTVQRIWVNGVEETASSSMNPPDYDYAMNKSGHLMAIGTSAWGIGESSFNSFDGYYAQVVHLDGQYITDPTEFGQFSETSGEWEPIEITSSSFNYGTNGALLEFLQDGTSADSSGIGADTSGNDNHWSISSIAAEDCVEDSPQSNFCTLNAISGPPRGGITFSEGNLKATGGYDSSAGYYPRIMGTMAASSGKWFYEVRVNTTLVNSYEVGFKGVNTTWPSASHGLGGGTTTWSTESEISYSDYWGGIKHCNSSEPETEDAGSYGTADTVIGIALDLDASPQTMKVWNEGTGYDSADLPTGGSDAFYPCIDLTSMTSGSLTVNFGQDATFVGTESGTTYTTDASGGDTGGEFTMQPPAGYKAWTAKNLTPAIAKPSEHFDIKTWTATSTNPKVLDFPWSFATDGGLVWHKIRGSGNGSNYLFDTVRGDNKGLYSNNSEIEEETSHSSYYTQDFDGSGDYSIQQDGVGNELNLSGSTYVAWGWKGGTTATQSGTHTYELGLELTDDYGDGWGGYSMHTTPQLKVYEGTAFLGDATITYEETGTQHYTIKTNNPDAIKIVWDYDSSDGGTLYQQGVTLKNGATTMATWTTSQLVEDAAVLQAQSTSTNETTVGTLSTGAPTTYPESNYNAAAGFSIAKWTGNDDDSSSDSSQTVNHNLGVVPEMVIAKSRTNNAASGGDWLVYHKDLTSGSYLKLNETDTETAWYNAFFDSITATKVDFGNDSAAFNYLNYGGDGTGATSADTYIGYFFASVEGYSKVGSYTGNGNNGDGTFVYCGFKPAYIMVKPIDVGHGWHVHDAVRSPSNISDLEIRVNTNLAEYSVMTVGGFDRIDILSNGFKNLHSNDGFNGDGNKYLFYAVAESPLKTALAR